MLARAALGVTLSEIIMAAIQFARAALARTALLAKSHQIVAAVAAIVQIVLRARTRAEAPVWHALMALTLHLAQRAARLVILAHQH